MKAVISKVTKSRAVLLSAVLTLTACAPLAQVREVTPRLAAAPGLSAPLQRAEEDIVTGQNLRRADPRRALGYYLRAVDLSTSALRKDGGDQLASQHYDFALSRVFSTIRAANLDPWRRPFTVPAPDGGEYSLGQRRGGDQRWQPQNFDLIPADELVLQGHFVGPRVTRPGIGAALVAVDKGPAAMQQQSFLPPRIYAAVTAVADFDGNRCQIEFFDPLASETVDLADRSRPLAADFTAPISLGLSRERPERMGSAAMFNPERFASQARLIQVQPYDRRKVPVLLVHGLQSTPVSWAPMINALWADPDLRRKYQVWVFAYPTGYPVPYSALLLRRQLNALDKSFPGHRPIVLVGHSMGGILCRLMISDSGGDKLWRYFFGTPPAQTALSPESRALVTEALIFRPQCDVRRTIFISTPHRGSVIAQGPVGRLASSLFRKPAQFAELGREIMKTTVVQEADPGVMKLNRMPNSIDTLAPNDAFVKGMNTLPLAKGVPYHSIIGDRGRGDTPNSSDGVVPHWSSHLEGAASEKIVPSGHNAELSPEGIAEVIRILHQDGAAHAQQSHGIRNSSRVSHDYPIARCPVTRR